MSSKVKTNKLSKYNPALDQYSNVDLFPEKTKRAKEVLSKPGVLDWLKNDMSYFFVFGYVGCAC